MRNRFLSLVVLATFAAPLSLIAQADGGAPQPISLADAVSRAQASSPLTVQARSASRVADATFTSAIAAFLPSVSLGQSAYRVNGQNFFQGSLISTSSQWSYQKGYSMNLTLFDGGQRILQFVQDRANKVAADQNQVIQRYAIALNVKQQYFAVLAAREAEAAAEQQLAEANEQMAVTAARIAGGAAPRSDSLASAVTVGTARLALITAQGQLVTANAALTRDVGGDHEVTATPADTALVPDIGVDSATLIRLALAGPGVRQAQEVLNANHAGRWAAIARYLPTLGVQYGYSRFYSTPHFILGGGSPVSNQQLYYYASYSLFDNFRREVNLVTAGTNADIAKAQLRDAQLAARESVDQYLAQFRTAEATIELQHLQIEAAQANVAASDAQYRAGAKTLLDVLTAQSTLATARQNLIQARLAARTAKAQIEAL
ncbi:MAG: TolC family protein, partial [Gemmatimonadota bacterium]|nr:TolC family protein [Gemmatimonadota bacterium]